MSPDSASAACCTGPLLNHTARVLSKAAPGQVLVDQNTWAQALDQAGDSLLGGVSLGEFQLKGLDEPVTLYQISREVPMRRARLSWPTFCSAPAMLCLLPQTRKSGPARAD